MKVIRGIRDVCAVFGLFASAIVLSGVLTSEEFEWWMVPTGIVCGAYLIGFIVYGYIKVRRREW